MMTCREVIDFLMDYVDGVVPSAQRAEFERHLAVCPPCVRYLDTYKATIAVSNSLYGTPDEPADARVPEELIQAILAARGKA